MEKSGNRTICRLCFLNLLRRQFVYAILYITIGFNVFGSTSPQNVVINRSGNTVNLTWNEVSGADEYYIYKGYLPYSEMTKVDSTSSLFYQETEVSEKCFYKVSAKDRFSVDMVFVSGGTYLMGDHYKEGYYDEQPLHQVTVNNFYIQNTEVTQKEWVETMGSENIVNSLWGVWGLGDNYPAYGVNWYDIVAFCNTKSITDGLTPCYTISGSTDPVSWGEIPTTQNPTWDAVLCNWNANGYRLVTEAEWEYAARGGINNSDDFRFSGCNEESDLDQYSLYGSGYFLEVQSKLPNQLGLYDMSGNVCEFCWDWYGDYQQANSINPTGTISKNRTRRGGARYSTPKGDRVSNRANYNPSYRYTGGEIGFRIGSSDTDQEFYAITVNFPDKETTLITGTTTTLKWTDNLQENVKLELYRDGVYCLTISNSISSNGSYLWKIPENLEPQFNYKVKISSILNPDINDMSDDNFLVSNEFIYSLNTLSPSKDVIWSRNRIQTIVFTDNFSDSLSIDLYKSGVFYSNITSNTSSDGKFEWLIPSEYEIGTDYSIKIMNTTNDSIFCFSEQFSIKEDDIQDMVFVDGGTFNMGDVIGDGYIQELPVHSVTLSSFYIAKREITQNEWIQIMGSNPSTVAAGIGGNYPVNNVNWYSILVYCNKRSISEGLTPCYTISGSTNPYDWGTVPTGVNSTWNAVICNWNSNGYRLPTEAEWEYAARGGIHHTDNYRFSGCDMNSVLNLYGWYDENNYCSSTFEIGTLLPNQLGLYDMSGNIWEWCWDWYAGYASSAQTNPTGPATASYRVQRGGSFYNSADICRVSFRDCLSPTYYMNLTGFRVAKSISSEVDIYGDTSIKNLELNQNFPNPFNPSTVISYRLPRTSQVELNVYNIDGQLVKSLVKGMMDKGIHKAEFAGDDLTSGMYVYNLNVDGKNFQSKKMMLVK